MLLVNERQLMGREDNKRIFEDTEIGIQAAQASGAQCIQVTSSWYLD